MSSRLSHRGDGSADGGLCGLRATWLHGAVRVRDFARGVSWLALVLALQGCGGEAPFVAEPEDAGSTDAGDVGADAGLESDAGLEAADAGVTDAGDVDAGVADAGSASDAGVATDAGPSGDDAGAVDAGVAHVELSCPPGFPSEAFRDDFGGASVDSAKWDVLDQGTGGGTFTQLTMMRRENVEVRDGGLVLHSQRHCENPRTNRQAPAHPAQCAGGNFYSGAWLKTKQGYAPGHGLMLFRAKMPPPVRGFFPALWARNTEGGALYVEFDAIEMTWDDAKGVPAAPDTFKVTTHFGAGAAIHAQGPAVGPFAGLTDDFHVWEVEWDAEASPPRVRYFYRDAPGAQRHLLRETTPASNGFAGHVSEADFAEGLRRGFRAYVDFAVMPETNWSVGVDSAPTYAPEDLVVDSIVICAP